ncbi:PaaI family thioesterase [Methylobacterium planeticum]|uniref:PaaI family thioesterase n=2 Tax=Methylobacterium planeticum TaxID=2615211 RepID=A0A6N6MRM9_9HYPH|nr:PaaI family thioesterase [Methylobacterium planeticum]KAB1073082.1 PaaI family thioesterase [Methylobacterium planeticum]
MTGMTDLAPSVMTLAEVVAFLEREFPQIHHGGRSYHLEAVGPASARMRMDHHERHLRPGGTVSGPAMMALADLALYAAILANIGPVALAVTTNLSFNFLRRPGATGLVGEARLLKLGRRLAVGEVLITAAGAEDLVCHATGTYSIPPRR